MFGKNAIYYIVSSTVIALVAQAFGASLPFVMFASLIGPAVILFALAVVRYKGWL